MRDADGVLAKVVDEKVPVFRHLRRISQRLTAALLLAALVLLPVAGGAAYAANEGCVVSGDEANCPDVPANGIHYENTGVSTVNVGDGVGGTIEVTPAGTIGILLRKTGQNASDLTSSVTYENTVMIDHDSDGGTAEWEVVADADDNPILVGTDYIRKTGADTFSIGATSYASSNALAEFLQTQALGNTGGTISGSLTVNNPTSGGTGAQFSTTNADGIRVESIGGKGSSGGCTTILLATWCSDGRTGGNAGSVAINSDGTIVVNGSGYGVAGISTGGTGGNGGGSFGLFASDAGRGGNGGVGAAVDIVLGVNSNITTWGNGGHGVYATSSGGNGGSGGTPSGAVALGDKGGNGGDAGEVTVTNGGAITTHGTKAYGIFAQSIGAGAGSGSGGGGIVALGGNGGGESNGNKVTVTNTGTIETWGQDSFGILAQSIGGGGGDGGSTGGIFAVGGKGGSGGGSDVVNVYNSGSITTHQAGSVGIFAQSVGGGGGNGGNAYSGGLGGSVAVGGDGGLGGAGGKVFVNQLTGGQTVADLIAGTITTAGDRSHGIQAQSVGGGGGNGGLAVSGAIGSGFSVAIALGGNGAKGGSADTVTVNEKGHITTTGNLANGIFAQSVGGGGGSGGGSVAVGVSTGYSLNLAIGGAGAEAGHGNTVIVNAMGGIDTTGNMSHGILAQSLGGGGGNGGYSVAAGGGGALTASVGLGGNGGGGGNGGSVTVGVTGIAPDDMTIHTRGAGSHGIFAQSVGGGGGSGGFAASGSLGAGAVSVSLGGEGNGGGIGGTVGVTNSNTVLTDGAGSYGLLAQSIGGGGGNGGFSLGAAGGVMAAAVAVGGKGGAGGNGGNVTVDNYGNITTLADLSYGILAQSVGGGGGNGGSSVAATVTISIQDVPAIGASVAIGGAGGTASLGGSVTLNNDGSISTGTRTLINAGTDLEEYVRTGNGAHALFAQSVGGGGGTGGFAGAGSLSLGSGASFAVAVGGRGGTGGNAGVVDLTNTGDAIYTWGNGADGIHAQSVGGGGGDAGFGLALAGSGGGTTNLSLGVAIGGKGGAGGIGNLVTVDNQGAITTDGKTSNGIFAQSIGGGGGNGGFAATGTATLSQTAGQIGVSVGGGGGNGNHASKVLVDNSGVITTYGENSLGILAQSIGGGGGNGGLSVVAQIVVGTENSAQVGVSVGGGGGTGSHGGEVEVNNLAAGDITTYGFASHGIEAQSVGGGGGNGGMSIYGGLSVGGSEKAVNVGVSVGGAGGTGGYGNTVTVENAGDIRVYADNAMGILAHSVGGGGGNGGNSITAMLGLTNVSVDEAATYNVAVSVGGNGGSGNHGGNVNVTNTGTIVTGSRTVVDDTTYVTGLGGYGVFAQSVGGGGGIGGRSNTINVVAGPKCTLPVVCTSPKSQANNLALSASVGGNGGSGGDGLTVTVDNQGEITTVGDLADGIFAQSIGGGGGVGGNGILGTGELLPVPVELIFIPVGQTAIYKDISVAVGGDGGASGAGGVVTVTNNKNITTLGGGSNGIFAQSVGGGGGVGGNGVIGATGKIGVGGKGGAAGDGGNVTVSNLGEAIIETFGTSSNGIFAQSVGGGGGVGGNVNRALAQGLDTPLGHLSVNLGIGLALGQGGGNGGTGGTVDVDVTGAILTHGDSAAGIFAQSVGGGGGVLGELGNDLPVLSLLSWHIGSNGDAGSAGVVTVDMDGVIRTAGNSATGIFAQSSGGLGTGGDVNVTLDGSVETAALLGIEDGTAEDPLRGLGSVGILAHSAGKGGNGNVTVDLQATTGLVKGGRSLVVNDDPLAYAEYVGVGIWVVDGNNNVITNRGTVTVADGTLAGMAIYATGSDAANSQAGGNEAVTNFGIVTGSVDLGVGTNSFDNELGATFNTGAFARLGAANLISNDGTLNVGGVGIVMRTSVVAELAQSSSGVYGVDLDLNLTADGDEADLLDVDQLLTLDGAVDLNILNAGNALPGQHQVAIAQSATSFDDQGITLTSPPSVVATYELETTATQLLLNYGIDFDVVGLNGNQSAIGEYINMFQLAGGSEALEPVVSALFFIPDLETYAATIDQLSPEPYVVNQVANLMATLQFENSLMSCRVADGDYKYTEEGQCAWASLGHRKAEREQNADHLGYDIASMALSAGAQAKVNEHISAGFGFGYESFASTSNNASTEGDRIQAGGVLKGQFGNTTLAGTLTGGYANQDVMRIVSLPNGPTYVLEGNQDVGFASAHLRAAHTIDNDTWYVRPMVDLGVTQVSMGGFEETGGPVALVVEAEDYLYATVAPAIELGAQMDLGEDAVLRSFVRVGALNVVLGSAPEISAGFSGAPDGVDPFTIVGSMDALMFDVTAGVDVITGAGAAFRLQGDAKIGETSRSYGGSVKISAPF